ncbi:hypothetical protein COCON_G00076470 [Conger conger]|uniref:WSC domain-containing protein n=1 Tax=Conger conger TaxID=82655 RepID=A0A9Q1DNQ6_CONCO|nr:sialate:O-sulfotransferase 1-like [Conger conger]KAJ8275895.1 hypothetical protein COCON_G00076470 [Conger conger]
MAKPFYILQRFLRRVQLLLLFLGVAYIMAGSVLLLQRSGQVVSQRGGPSLPPMPSLPSLHKAPGEGRVYGSARSQMAANRERDPDDPSRGRAGPHWLVSRNLEIRLLRRRWFHHLEQESQVERGPVPRKVGHKGTYVGCFLDDKDNRALGGNVFYDFRKMTSTLCQDTCSESGYRFAGLEYGAECYCGNRISTSRTREEDCNLDCKGEKGSPCGGVGRLSIYKVEELLPGQRRYRNVRYRGCFERPKNITAAFLVHSIQPNLTLQSCIETCTIKELPLAVLRRPDCFCGYVSSRFTLHQPAEERYCAHANATGPITSVDREYYQVYQTPVQDSRCTERKFLPEKSNTLVALTSFPGAGNTWVRHLIELATGFYTGSFYFDGTLYNKGFKGEKDYWKSGRTICVKTHESGRHEIEMYDSAILLIRNPYRCLMAEFNRKCAGHLGHAAEQHWKSNEWPEFVSSYASWWASHVLDWLKFGRQVLVVHYEELQGALFLQLRHIASFLNISITDERLLCAQSNQDGHFKRSATQKQGFDPFTPEMKLLIDGYIHTVDSALRDRNYTGLPQEYLPR